MQCNFNEGDKLGTDRPLPITVSRGLAQFFGDLSQCEKIFEIKPPLIEKLILLKISQTILEKISGQFLGVKGNFRDNFGDNFGDNYGDNFGDNFRTIW